MGKKIGLDFRAHDDLKGMKKQKKLVKKLAKGYDAFLASSNLIKQVPRLVGPILNKIGKFPVAVPSGGSVEDKVADIKNTVKFSLKIKAAINFLLTLMKKGWQNIRRIHIKTTMGKPHKI